MVMKEKTDPGRKPEKPEEKQTLPGRVYSDDEDNPRGLQLGPVTLKEVRSFFENCRGLDPSDPDDANEIKEALTGRVEELDNRIHGENTLFQRELIKSVF